MALIYWSARCWKVRLLIQQDSILFLPTVKQQKLFPFFFEKAALKLLSVLPSCSLYLLFLHESVDRCYWFKSRCAVKCRSDIGLAGCVFSCPPLLSQLPRFIDRLEDEASIIIQGILCVALSLCLLSFPKHSSFVHIFSWDTLTEVHSTRQLKMDRDGQYWPCKY